MKKTKPIAYEKSACMFTDPVVIIAKKLLAGLFCVVIPRKLAYLVLGRNLHFPLSFYPTRL